MLAHSGLIHALYGGFFGWWGAALAIAPDLPLVVGFLRWIIARDRYYCMWLAMPEWARALYVTMHSLHVAALVCLAEIAFTGRVYFALGYLSHVLVDWFLHHHDIGQIILIHYGIPFGINWYETKFYWTEWAGLALSLGLYFSFQWSNVLLNWL